MEGVKAVGTKVPAAFLFVAVRCSCREIFRGASSKCDRINGKPLSENAAKSGFFSGNLGI